MCLPYSEREHPSWLTCYWLNVHITLCKEWRNIMKKDLQSKLMLNFVDVNFSWNENWPINSNNKFLSLETRYDNKRFFRGWFCNLWYLKFINILAFSSITSVKKAPENIKKIMFQTQCISNSVLLAFSFINIVKIIF